MTHIASYPTKKAFAEAVRADPSKVYVDDPAIVRPNGGRLTSVLAQDDCITVTNHPKRSWYARVFLNRSGSIVVD